MIEVHPWEKPVIPLFGKGHRDKPYLEVEVWSFFRILVGDPQ